MPVAPSSSKPATPASSSSKSTTPESILSKPTTPESTSSTPSPSLTSTKPSTSHKAAATSLPTPISTGTSSKSVEKTTTIIIAVVASVAGILVVFLLFRLIRRRWNRRSANPLPPVQPIAHHREQQLFQFEEAKFSSLSSDSPRNSARGTWYAGQQHLTAPSPMPTQTGSDSSLSAHKETDPFLSAPPSPAPRREYSDQSLGTSRMSMSPDDDNKPLPPPAPAFHHQNNSSAGSSGSSTPSGSAHSEVSFARSYSNPHPLTESTLLVPPAHPRPRSSNASTHPIRPRPNSMLSTTSRSSRHVANTARGAPHSPHSKVQIVLPAPLAPALGPYGNGESGDRWGSGAAMSENRMPVVDQWAGLSTNREEPPWQSREKEEMKRKRRTSRGGSPAADSRPSTSTLQTESTSASHPNNPFSSQAFVVAPYRSPSQASMSSPLSAGAPRTVAPPPSSFHDGSRTPPPPMPAIFAGGRRRRLSSSAEGSSEIERRRSASRDRPVSSRSNSLSRTRD